VLEQAKRQAIITLFLLLRVFLPDCPAAALPSSNDFRLLALLLLEPLWTLCGAE
jgi:hypothetical protein